MNLVKIPIFFFNLATPGIHYAAKLFSVQNCNFFSNNQHFLFQKKMHNALLIYTYLYKNLRIERFGVLANS